MHLRGLSLQNFRTYSSQAFHFNPQTTVIVGPNTAGKTNLIEALFLLASGKSFHAQSDTEMIQFGENLGRAKGIITEDGNETTLEVVIAEAGMNGKKLPSKRYLINGIAKRRMDFQGILKALLFVPSDLDIITGSPSQRRAFFDDVLELTDREYRHAHLSYIRAIRQRNALLEAVKEQGIRNDKLFEYWDEMLIINGQILTQKRETFVEFVNAQKKAFLSFQMEYDRSAISEERLLQYKDAERGAGVTLVGPHRDDFQVYMENGGGKHDIKLFGSRGQQRLVVLQLKLAQLAFLSQTGEKPVLLLDDVFSELDEKHIELVLNIAKGQQTIITTTHKEFVTTNKIKDMAMVELGGGA